MNYNQKNRYPGTQPFTAEQINLFHGRDMETDDLLKLIRFQQMVVLYGKSELGKSSLLNASIKPKVETRKIADVFAIRFNALNENKTENKTENNNDNDTPIEKTFAALMLTRKSAMEAVNDNTLWFAAKARQLTEKKKSFLLVFDQFEELFTYSERDIESFKNQLSELLRSGLPKRFEDKIKSLNLSEADLDILYEPADIKVLFAIRSDRMHLLDKLSDVLPDILRHCYELNALIEADARKGITLPAEVIGDYKTPPFSYEPRALDNIISFLKEKDADGRIEAIQLQTLCQAFENKITQSTATSITAADTPPEKLKTIIDEYYNTQLDDARIPDKDLAHRLIEDELVIDSGDGKGVRVTLHELSLKAKFAKGGQAEEDKLKKLLETLVNVHLLRREVGSRGGDTYELSHDRLIEPVLKSKALFTEIEKQKRIAAENAAREKELTEANARAATEKRGRQRATVLAIAAGVLFLVSAFFGFYARQQTKLATDATTEAVSQKNNAQTNLKLAQQSSIKAQLSADSATMARIATEKYLKLANTQTGIATDALKQAETNFKKAKAAEDTARAEQAKTKLALNEAQAANARVVTSYLKDIDQHILELEYDAAFEKCQTALSLNVESKKDELTKCVLEIAYFYTETDTLDAADKTLQLINITVGKDRNNLLSAIKNADTAWFSFLEERYYPKMISVESDTFTMGSNDYNDEKPVHAVKVGSFKIAETETTFWQYNLYAKAEHGHIEAPSWQFAGDNPAVNVSWDDAVAYLKWLSEHRKKKYKLPTEAQWEFAARGGNKSHGFKYSGDSVLNKVAWNSDNSGSRTHTAKTKKANELGLYDMSGNVWEWCSDEYSKTFYAECLAKGIVTDPFFEKDAEKDIRVVRGGSWDSSNYDCRVSSRSVNDPDDRLSNLGFRVVSGYD